MNFNNQNQLKTTLRSIFHRGHNTTYMSTLHDIYRSIDMDDVHDETCVDLIDMIKTALEGVSKNIHKPQMLFEYCRSNNEDLNTELETGLEDNMDGEYLDKIMNTYSAIRMRQPMLEKMEDLIDMWTQFKISGINSTSDSIEEMAEQVNDIHNEMNTNMSIKNGKILEFEEDRIIGFQETMKEMRETEQFRVYTGTGIDDHFHGFAPTKLYDLISPPGGGKSLTLENIALLVRHANDYSKEELEGEVPIVVYITLENTRVQSLRRALSFYGYKTNDIDKMSDTKKEAICMKHIAPKDETDIRLSIQQYKRYSVDSNHLINLVKQYKNNGKRVIALVVDYLALLEYRHDKEDQFNSKMPIVKKAEDLKTVAINAFVPVITASQTNRGGERSIEEAKKGGKKVVDPIKMLNATHIAGGYQIKGEVDYLAFVLKDEFNGKDYLAMMQDKQRDYKDDEDNSKKGNMTVMPMDGFKITEDKLRSALELFPENMTTVNVLNEANREFKKELERAKDNMDIINEDGSDRVVKGVEKDV